MSIQLSGICVYPVKALAAVAVTEAVVQPEGLTGDRRWVIIDANGNFLSQRQHGSLARIQQDQQPTGLTLTADGFPPLELAPPYANNRRTVRIWSDEVNAAAAPPEADRWLSEYLSEPVHLAWMDSACHRPITSSGGQPGESVSFADGYPCLIVSEASLADLNGRLERPVPMNRFRPNLIISGCDSFAEDSWSHLTIGGVRFRNAGPCARCSVPTVNQISGEIDGPEPLRTLATFRQHEKGIIFGTNLVAKNGGTIRVGDRVEPQRGV